MEHLLELQKQLDQFLRQWNSIVAANPALALDGSWESIGVVDLFLMPYRGATDSPLDPFILHALTLYCSQILEQLWVGAELHTTIRYDLELGVSLELFREDRSSIGVLPLEEIIRGALTGLSRPIQIWDSFERLYGDSDNVLSDLLRGVAFLRLGERYQLTLAPEILRDVEVAVERGMARTCLRRYGEIYPEEQMGQIGDLYFGGILSRSDFVGELYPLSAVIADYAAELSSLQLIGGRLVRFGENLSRSPEPRLAGLGYTLGCAFGGTTRSPALEATSVSSRAALYRRSVDLIRTAAGGTVFSFGATPESEARFVFERTVGLLPGVWCASSILQLQRTEPRVTTFIEALRALSFKDAFQIVQQLVEEKPGWIEFRIQYIGMLYGNRQYSEIPTLCKVLLTEPGMEGDPRVNRLWGLSLLRMDRVPNGVERLDAAYRYSTPGLLEYENIVNDLGYALLLQGRFLEALVKFEEVIQRNPSLLFPRINRLLTLNKLGLEVEAQAERDRLLALAPANRTVFRLAFLER